jgi:hypothetical protein
MILVTEAVGPEAIDSIDNSGRRPGEFFGTRGQPKVALPDMVV